VEKFLEIPSFHKKFSGVPSKNISFTATFYWNSINSSWVSAASTPVVSSCRNYALPLSSVNDGSLPVNICKDAQQTSSTYTNFHFIFGAHMCMCLFASVENSVMSVTKKGFEKRAATVFEKKVAKLFNKLLINFSMCWIYLESPCFYFPQMPWKMTKFVSNGLFEDLKLFLESTSSIDQIKSSRLCFSPWSFTFKSLRCDTVSAKIQQFPFLYHFLKNLKMP